MRNLRNVLLVATGMLFGACATQTFRPEEAPEYVVTRDPTPFYLSKPRQEGTPDAALSADTRVKLLRKQAGYSLVLLEDSRTGYVANAYITQAPPESQQRPFGSSPETEPRAPKEARSPESDSDAKSAGRNARRRSQRPCHEHTGISRSQAPPEEVPSPTPAPETPLEKPKFRL